MGRIVICEPDSEVRDLLGRVVVRMGREPVAEVNGAADIDALIVEPADRAALARAHEIRRRHPHVPIVCASIDPPDEASRDLSPVAHLMKPFALPELERALHVALLHGALAAP